MNVVILSNNAKKDLRKLPYYIVLAFAAWVDDIEERGLLEVRSNLFQLRRLISMNTKRKSNTMKFLEEVSGKPLSFGALVESMRLSEEISQTVFAKKLGISSSHLCDIEKGRKAVSAARAAQFAKILERSESQFVRLALQDELERSGLKLKISVSAA